MAGPRVIVIGAAAHIFPRISRGSGVGAEVVGVHDINAERLEPVAERLGCPAFDGPSTRCSSHRPTWR